MAFGAKQISPIDFNKSAAVGIDIPFSEKGVFKSSCLSISKLLISMFGKNVLKSFDILSFKKSKLSVDICSKINDLNPPPKFGFNGLSPGLVKK